MIALNSPHVVNNRMRRARSGLFALLLCGGLCLAYRLIAGPGLRPLAVQRFAASDQLYFSAADLGYPAIREGRNSRQLLQSRWLDDDGTPQGTPFFMLNRYGLSVGIRRDAVIAFLPDKPNTQAIDFFVPYPNIRSWRDGRRERLPRAYDSSIMTRKAAGGIYYASPFMQSDDPTIVALQRYPHLPFTLALFDRQRQRIVQTIRTDDRQYGVVRHAGNRMLVVLQRGRAQLFAGGKRLGSYGTPTSTWYWGEDDSAWTITGTTAQVLCWRSGTPRLITLPLRIPTDDRVPYLGHPEMTAYDGPDIEMPPSPPADANPSLAIWGDGRLAATVRTVRFFPDVIDRQLEKSPKLHAIPRHARILTLYRNGRRVGSFRLNLAPQGYDNRYGQMLIRGKSTWRPQTVLCREHLAFSEDGRYLAWVMATAREQRLYAFAVPR